MGRFIRASRIRWCFCGLCLAATSCSRAVNAQTNAQRVGSAHVAGKYAFTSGDYLNEGATQILRTGMKVIKVYLSNPAGEYPFNSTWPPSFASQVQIAQHPYYQKLFAMPFETFVMTTYSKVSTDNHYWRNGVTPEQYSAERSQFYDLAHYFLVNYNGTGKTFVLAHWEGDWALRGTTDKDPIYDPTAVPIQGMIDWLNARQEGVDLARLDVPNTDVKVYHACEVNLVKLAMQGRPTVTNNVVPFTHCDLYSYSAWDTISFGRQQFHDALDYLASKAPDRAPFGDKNVYSGEYGWPEQEAGTSTALTVIKNATDEALAWGCPYALFWQIYDNECSANPASNADCRGFWLIRRDASSSAGREYLVSVINPTPLGTNLARGSTQVATDSNNSASQMGAKAIDGVIASTSKWVSAGTAVPHWLALDLGKDRTVHTYVVRHAGAGGETTNFNTEQFRVQSAASLAGPWTDEHVISNTNRYRVTLRNYFTTKVVRYVRLYITDPGTDNFARIPEFEVWGDSAAPEFSGLPTSGNVPLTVDFTDATTGNVDTWLWDFGDTGTSGAQNPSHIYTRPGLYTVTLTVGDAGGSYVSTKVGYIRAIGADLDGDGDVDGSDFGRFQACMTGPAIPQDDPACVSAYLDDDTDVDSEDFARFVKCISGANIAYNPACMN